MSKAVNSENTETKQIRLWVSRGCRACRIQKREIEDIDVPIELIHVEDHPRRALIRGIEKTPTIEFAGMMKQGITSGEMIEALHREINRDHR